MNHKIPCPREKHSAVSYRNDKLIIYGGSKYNTNDNTLQSQLQDENTNSEIDTKTDRNKEHEQNHNENENENNTENGNENEIENENENEIETDDSSENEPIIKKSNNKHRKEQQHDNNEALNDLWVLDINNHRWMQLDTIGNPSPRHSHTSDIIEHKLFIIGGAKTNEIYKPFIFNDRNTTTSQSQALNKINHPHAHHHHNRQHNPYHKPTQIQYDIQIEQNIDIEYHDPSHSDPPHTTDKEIHTTHSHSHCEPEPDPSKRGGRISYDVMQKLRLAQERMGKLSAERYKVQQKEQQRRQQTSHNNIARQYHSMRGNERTRCADDRTISYLPQANSINSDYYHYARSRQRRAMIRNTQMRQMTKPSALRRERMKINDEEDNDDMYRPRLLSTASRKSSSSITVEDDEDGNGNDQDQNENDNNNLTPSDCSTASTPSTPPIIMNKAAMAIASKNKENMQMHHSKTKYIEQMHAKGTKSINHRFNSIKKSNERVYSLQTNDPKFSLHTTITFKRDRTRSTSYKTDGARTSASNSRSRHPHSRSSGARTHVSLLAKSGIGRAMSGKRRTGTVSTGSGSGSGSGSNKDKDIKTTTKQNINANVMDPIECLSPPKQLSRASAPHFAVDIEEVENENENEDDSNPAQVQSQTENENEHEHDNDNENDDERSASGSAPATSGEKNKGYALGWLSNFFTGNQSKPVTKSKKEGETVNVIEGQRDGEGDKDSGKGKGRGRTREREMERVSVTDNHDHDTSTPAVIDDVLLPEFKKEKSREREYFEQLKTSGIIDDRSFYDNQDEDDEDDEEDEETEMEMVRIIMLNHNKLYDQEIG